MGEMRTRGWVTGVAAVLALTTTGCMQLVRQWELEGALEGVESQIDGDDERIAQAEAASEAAANAANAMESDVRTLRRELETLRQEFGGHINDEDVHASAMAVSLPVHFDFNSSDVRSVDRPVLDAFAAVVMDALPTAKITVEGSTDAAGDAAYNLRLSTQRAESVRTYLVESAGMSAKNVSAVGLGETRLISDATGMDDRQDGMENRRVTFVVEWPGG